MYQYRTCILQPATRVHVCHMSTQICFLTLKQQYQDYKFVIIIIWFIFRCFLVRFIKPENYHIRTINKINFCLQRMRQQLRNTHQNHYRITNYNLLVPLVSFFSGKHFPTWVKLRKVFAMSNFYSFYFYEFWSKI